MFRRILNSVAIASAISILPYATGAIHADPEGNCRRECANYKCFAKLAEDGKVIGCHDWTDVLCYNGSDDYCHPDIGCYAPEGGCEDWLEDGKKKPIEFRTCTPTTTCTLTCPNSLPLKSQPALGCSSAKCEPVKGQPQFYRTRCKGGSK